ncbi:MAG: hypothetical protein KF716_15475 [Anaerolineae bacterium]|nr:hypothetical protein [Anaerolineae bacterium]
MSSDLVILVADKDTEFALKGLFSRPQSLGIRSIEVEILIHIQRDPGCWNEADSFLRPFSKQFAYALVIFDHQGCGQEDKMADRLEEELEQRLNLTGWEDRSHVVILQPELEIWVWSDSPKVDECLGWTNKSPSLRHALREQDLLDAEAYKPHDPKLALEWALRQVKKPRSSDLYKRLAEQVSFQRCTDQSFLRFKNILQTWFPPNN